VFNLSGTELVFLVVIALVVLGPEKLPEAVRKFAKTYGELKKMSTGFQSELRNALDEPMKEIRATADALRNAANLDAEPDQPSIPPAASQGSDAAPAGSTTEASPAATVPVDDAGERPSA
jgi:sec-independent protein translocase protein TatB